LAFDNVGRNRFCLLERQRVSRVPQSKMAKTGKKQPIRHRSGKIVTHGRFCPQKIQPRYD
jgi:hypothetical protein